MAFPIHRPRRLRRTEALRRMVRETELSPLRLHLPALRRGGPGGSQARPLDARHRQPLGGPRGRGGEAGPGAGHPLRHPLRHPRPQGRRAAPGPGPRTASSRRRSGDSRIRVPELQLIADVCLCEYTDHGHCGVIHGGEVDNDQSLPLLAQMAVSCARAGADIVAPSDMMDGRVAAIRKALDEAGLSPHADPQLRGQVRLGLLRAVPGGRPEHAPVRGSPRLPDGPGQRPRGAEGGRARPRRGRGSGDGEARAQLPRRHRPGEGSASMSPSPRTTSPASTRW